MASLIELGMPGKVRSPTAVIFDSYDPGLLEALSFLSLIAYRKSRDEIVTPIMTPIQMEILLSFLFSPMELTNL